MYQSDIRLGDTIDLKFTTRRFTSGAPFALDSGAIAAYPGNSTTEITAGITLTADFDGRTGLNNVRVVATGGNGYATATNYVLVITAGTVDGVSVVGECVGSFSIENRSALMPTVAARTLDVTATGATGIDWGNIENPTTAQNLSATNIDVDQVIASVSGAVGSVAANGLSASSLAADAAAEIADAVWDEDATGHQTQGTFGQAIGDPAADTDTIYSLVTGIQTDTDDIQTRLPAALVGGRMDSNAGAISGDATAADNAEAFFDGTGYAGTNNVIPTVTTLTGHTPQTGDSFARLGAPAGASVSADIAAIEGQTDDIGVAGAGLTNVPWNASWDAEVQSEVQDAIEANHLDHLLAVTYDPASKPGAADALLNELVESDAGVARYTANALEQAPTDGAAPTAAAIADAVWDEPTLGHTTADTFGEQLKTDVDAILVDTGTTLQGELDGIQADTEDIQTRLPAALTGGRMESNTGAMAAAVLTAAAIAANAINAAKLDPDVTTELQAGLATSASITALSDDVAEVFAAVDTEITDIKTKTDQLAFTTPNRVDSQVFGMQANTVSASALAADAVDEFWDDTIGDGTLTARQALRVLTAALSGKLSGAATTTITIRNAADTADVIVATVDADGNRSAVTLTP